MSTENTDPFNGELAALYTEIEQVQDEAKTLAEKATRLFNRTTAVKQRIINLATNHIPQETATQ